MALASAQTCTIQISIPEKIMGYPKQSLEKKNLFVKKYDEIRRLDGINICITGLKVCFRRKGSCAKHSSKLSILLFCEI